MNSDEYIFPNLALKPVPTTPDELKDVSTERFVKLTQKTTEVIRENYKSTTPTKYDNNEINSQENNDKVIYRRHTGLKTKNGFYTNEKATDTAPKKKTYDFDYPHN